MKKYLIKLLVLLMSQPLHHECAKQLALEIGRKAPSREPQRWRRLRDTLKLPKSITPYSYRHTSITNMILAGHLAAWVAEVHGTSVEMITRFYGHLDGPKKAMAAFWARAKAIPADGSAGLPAQTSSGEKA